MSGSEKRTDSGEPTELGSEHLNNRIDRRDAASSSERRCYEHQAARVRRDQCQRGYGQGREPQEPQCGGSYRSRSDHLRRQGSGAEA
jgi:hypothetical protein